MDTAADATTRAVFKTQEPEHTERKMSLPLCIDTIEKNKGCQPNQQFIVLFYK